MIRLKPMNDTNKQSLTGRQLEILAILSFEQRTSSSAVLARLESTLAPKDVPSLVTIKRELDILTDLFYCLREGKGRTTGYRLSTIGRLLRPVDMVAYSRREPDERTTYTSYVFEFFPTLPDKLLSPEEIAMISQNTDRYHERCDLATPVIKEKEMERFVIELAWKSSAIEGNTYSLLDTETLLKQGIPAPGHSPAETQMIINHKQALHFVTDTLSGEKNWSLNQRFVEQVHEILVKDLGIKTGPRATLVGITGSAYSPLDNRYQINEALEALYMAIKRLSHPVEQALIALAGLSYIQPFEDGNKRTARLVSNAILLAHNFAPLSYRNVDIEAYRAAMLIFYEQLSLVAVRDIFIDQYLFSTEHYLVHKN